MQIFYTPDITNCESYVLNETESKHAIRVLRLKIGNNITLVNGKGSFYNCEITDDNPKKCEVHILNFTSEKERPSNLHIAIAPTKNNDRLEWFTEKCTEIGISEITPILCSNSERKKLKEERIVKTAVSAMKQSLKATLPIISPITPFNKLVKQPFDGQKFIAHCYKNEKNALKEAYTKNENVLILIGPEGDFSEDEVTLAIHHGFSPISLGNSRLRTETAGIAACHTINLINE